VKHDRAGPTQGPSAHAGARAHVAIPRSVARPRSVHRSKKTRRPRKHRHDVRQHAVVEAGSVGSLPLGRPDLGRTLEVLERVAWIVYAALGGLVVIALLLGVGFWMKRRVLRL
jgi:hypothetical protein